jgi:type VI secretion system protein ImpK
VPVSSAAVPPDAASLLAQDHTVFRPNPGGRKPSAPSALALADTVPITAPRQGVVQSAELRAPSDNPVLSAAAPLLLLLGRLRASLVRAHPASLTPQIAEAIQRFDADLQAEGIAEDQAKIAKYIVCATADKVLANLPGEDRAGAARESIMTRFFGEATNGQKVFETIESVKSEPGSYQVVELAHACLALGFQGAHRSSTAADALERDVQHELYEVIEKAKAQQSRYLSPHWEGQAIPSLAVRLHIPFWAVAGVVFSGLFLLFIGMRLWLSHRAELAAQTMIALNPSEPVTLARRSAVSPPPAIQQSPEQISQFEKIKKALQTDIAANLLSLDTTPNQIIIRLPEASLFQPGKTSLLDSAKTLLSDVVAALATEDGGLRIIGNLDTTQISNARFASNFEVSQAYAETVASFLKPKLPSEQIAAEGKGSDAPIATNDTAEGRQLNRRVDIVVPRRD